MQHQSGCSFSQLGDGECDQHGTNQLAFSIFISFSFSRIKIVFIFFDSLECLVVVG